MSIIRATLFALCFSHIVLAHPRFNHWPRFPQDNTSVAGPTATLPLNPSSDLSNDEPALPPSKPDPPPFIPSGIPPTIPADQIPPAVRTVCNGREGIVRSVRKLPGTNLTITAGDCPDDTEPVSGTGLSARGGCNFPDNTCAKHGGGNIFGFARCGAPCTTHCYGGLGGPNPNDCQAIVNELRNNPNKIVLLQTDKWLLFTGDSCAAAMQNQIRSQSATCATTLIYDLPDMATIAEYIAWNCQAPQNAKGGICVADAGDWYIHVYTNDRR